MDVAAFRRVEDHFQLRGSDLDRAVWERAKARNMRARLISDDEGSPYLLRLYLTPHKDDEIGEKKEPRRFPAVFLHYFFRGDHDREHHNHPWKWALSFILTRGYLEERLIRSGYFWGLPLPQRGHLVTHRRRPGTFNLIRQNDFHRVLLDKGSCWTVFIAGPKVPAVRGEDWGFVDEKGVYISWGERDRQKGIDRGNGPTVTVGEAS